jgi:peroxiredoxin family protein
MVPKMISAMQRMKAPTWYDMLKQAKQHGDVKVYGCSTTCELLGLKKENLDGIVDDIVGAATLMQETAGYQILFI